MKVITADIEHPVMLIRSSIGYVLVLRNGLVSHLAQVSIAKVLRRI